MSGMGGGGGGLYKFETFCFVMRKSSLEENGVHPELGVEKGHVSVHLDKEVDALVSLVEVRVVVGERLGTAWATEGPARCNLCRGKDRKGL